MITRPFWPIGGNVTVIRQATWRTGESRREDMRRKVSNLGV